MVRFLLQVRTLLALRTLLQVRKSFVARTLLILAYLLTSAPAPAEHHHHGGEVDPSNPLACDPAAGEACFQAALDDHQAHHSPHPAAQGMIHLALNAAQTELRYQIQIEGLNLKPLPADRTAPDDVIGVHLHLFVPDTVGPHVLNIFGLATYNMPAEEDADLVVDYANGTLTGIYDDGDATIDPATGEPYLPFYPLTSKPLADWVDDLARGELMLAVHTNASGFPAMAIHGLISEVVPEPAAWPGIFGTLAAALVQRRRLARRN